MEDEKKYIDINHISGDISNPNGNPLTLGTFGGICVGTGDSLPSNDDISEGLEKYKGYMRTNKSNGRLQICDGKQWLDLMTENEEKNEENIINSLIF